MLDEAQKENIAFDEEASGDVVSGVSYDPPQEILNVPPPHERDKEHAEIVLADWPLGKYLSVGKWWILGMAGLEIALYLLTLVPSLNRPINGIAPILFLILEIVMFIWLGVLVGRKHQGSVHQTMTMAAISGVALGLIMGVFKIIFIRELWTAFNLITEPVLTGLVGLVVGFLTGKIVVKKRNKKEISL